MAVLSCVLDVSTWLIGNIAQTCHSFLPVSGKIVCLSDKSPPAWQDVYQQEKGDSSLF